MAFQEVWRFETAHFCVTLDIEYQYGYQYDGDDEDGETQSQLDAGKLVAFDSSVTVRLKSPLARVSPVPVGADYLGGSVYEYDNVKDFWTAHRDPDPMNRNCTIMRAAHGEKVSICHYFPDMVRQACAEARRTLLAMPEMRLSGRTA